MITRVGISYAVSIVNQFINPPRAGHLNAVYKILKYLKKLSGQGILYSRHGHQAKEA